MSRTILFVGGGIETVPGIRRAQEMGLYVVVSDGSPLAPGMAVADASLAVSTYDVGGTVAAAVQFATHTRPLEGVICLGTDVPHTVAGVAETLGLPGIGTEAAVLSIDKLAMKRRFAADGVPIPWFSPVESAAHLSALIREEGLPLVVKPVDSRGARGVLRLGEGTDPVWAFAHAKEFSPSGRVMVERFLDGPQVSTESIVLEGTVHTPGFSDRNYEYLERYAPHIIENGGELPSHLPPRTQENVRAVVAKAARSLGIETGVIKGDIVVHDGHAHVIEIAARLSGGYFCSHEIPLNTGVDFVGAAIHLALGDAVPPEDLTPSKQVGVAQRYLFPPPGRVTAIEGVESVAERPYIEMVEIRVKVGDLVGPIRFHPARAGVVLATGKDRAQAASRAERAISDLRITTTPG